MRQLLVLFVLVLVMQIAVEYGVPVDGEAFDSLTLVTTGFILIGAYTMGELFRQMRLPALLGYLAAGMLFGPKLALVLFGSEALAPISASVIPELGLINLLAVGVIGTMGGSEIKLADLRENFGKLVLICGTVFVLVLPAVAGLVLGLTFIAPGLVPFLADLPMAGRIAGALLFGALAVGMSPSATLALLQEVRAHGRFTSLVLGVVVLGDLVLVATFLLILALAKLLISPDGLSVSSLAEQLPHIAAEFGWALVIGVIVGVIYILYLRFVRREVLLFSLAVMFVTSFVCARLHAETLLAFLVAGFVVQNFSRHGHTLIEAFERILLPVFVIYFTNQAAALDLIAVTAYLPLTLMLVALRISLFWFGIGFGARRAGVDDVTRKQLQSSFYSQGGVDLVLAAMIAEAIPGWGAEIQTVTVATILFYVIGGPPFLARALDAMGESEAARERGAEDLESQSKSRTSSSSTSRSDEDRELVEPENEDPILSRRLAQLYAVVIRLRDELIDGQILARARQRRHVVDDLAQTIRHSLAELPTSDVARAAAARSAELDAAIVGAGNDHPHAQLEPFDGRTLTRLFRELDDAQRFGESHRIVRTPDLFEPRGGRVARVIRLGRRIRRALAGPGMRTVPIGRLWRYHVSLEVPVVLWSNTRPAEASVWHALLDHHRITRAQLDALHEGTWSSMVIDVAALQPAGHDPGHGHAADTDERPAEPISLDEWLARARAQADERALAIHERLVALDEELEQALLCGLARAWSSFVDSVELAGTLERPAWRYRPSSRYDVARAATAELLERGRDDRERAAGRFDAMLARANAQQVARAIRVAATEFEARFGAALAELHEDFEHALTQCRTLSEQGDNGRRSGAQLGVSLDRMGAHVERLRRQLSALAMTEPASLRRSLNDTPELLEPSSDIADDASPTGDARRTLIRLRAWLSQTLVQDFVITRSAAEDELGAGLANLRQALAHIARVVEYHLGANALARQPHHDEGLGERIGGLLERAREQVEELGRIARIHVDEKIVAAEQASLGPILAHRWDEIRRRLRRLDESPRAAVIEWLREQGQSTVARMRAGVHGFKDELSALFDDRPTAEALASWRRALFGPRSSMTEPYQRLFTSVPAETVGLLIPRPELAVLTDQADRWLAGAAGSILVSGERGSGKRTLVRQLLAELGERVEVRWLRLSPSLEREDDIARELGQWLGLPTDDSRTVEFGGLAQRIQALAPATWRRAELWIDDVDGITGNSGPTEARRMLVVVENTERLFRRTHEGLVRVRRFLELVAATSDQLLWVVLMAEPAVQVLDAALELRARFPAPLQVPPMTASQLEQVLDSRHRLSGYSLRLEPGVPSLAGWLRGPGTAWRLWREHDAATFERLAQLSGGNVRQALRLWLSAAHLDPHDPSTVVIGPLPADTCSLLDDLPLSSRVLLAALMFHGPLPRADLLALHGQHSLDLDAELARLAHLDLVVLDATSFPVGLVVSVETRLVQPMTTELRACNLL